MHLSQLLACALLLTLLSLRPSEAKPGAPPKVGAPRSPDSGELAEPQAAGGGQKKGDKTPGGGGANLKGDRSRLLRDLRVDTKSRGAWARLLHEHPNARKYKGGNKKGLSKGCFGLKLDRIGSMSGLGC
nr:PREDICTED: C-type natriuretic peptide [Equus przewalskii]